MLTIHLVEPFLHEHRNSRFIGGSCLQTLPASRHLPSSRGGENILDDLSKLMTAINTDDLDTDRTRALLDAILNKQPDEVI